MNLRLSLEELKMSIEVYYPFTIDQLRELKGHLNFNHLSENENVKWDYHVLKEFETLWNWNLIGKNTGVNSKITLGLLFPDRFDLAACDCPSMMDFCECYKQQPRNLKYEKSLKNDIYQMERREQFSIEFFIKSCLHSEDIKTVVLENKLPNGFNFCTN